MDQSGEKHARGEYRFLRKYLTDRYAHTVVLTFAEIEDLLGCALPDGARLAAWWTDAAADGTPSVQSLAWVSARRSAVPHLEARTVWFERMPD